MLEHVSWQNPFNRACRGADISAEEEVNDKVPVSLLRPITRAHKSSLHHSREAGLELALSYPKTRRTGCELKDFLVRSRRDPMYYKNDRGSMPQPTVVDK